MTRTTAIAAALLAAVAVACGDSNRPPENADDVFESWRNAGLDVDRHEPLAEHGAGEATCQRGAVAGVETTLWAFDHDDAALAAQPAGLKMVGEATGASLARGRVLLVVADREGSDPHGKTINAVTKTFLAR